MTILDANAILRYILNDVEEQADKVEEILQTDHVLILPEILAEVIYILTKYYNQPRSSTSECLLEFLNDADNCKDFLLCSLNLFGSSNFDFVDCLLYSYSKHQGHNILSFDKKLMNLVRKC